MQRLLPPHLFATLLILMIGAGLLAPWPSFHWVLRLVGGVISAGGLVLTFANARRFAHEETNIITFNDPDLLIQTGAYRWTRNPMYLGFVTTLIGVALALGAAVAFVGPAVFFLVADRWYITFEERRLEATFSESYDQYRAAVPRWLGVVR